MTVKDVLNTPNGCFVNVKGLIKKKKRMESKLNKPYLMIVLADTESSIEFPIWDNVEERDSKLQVGQLIRVVGEVSEYQGDKQIKVKGVEILDTDKEDMSLFIPRYSIDERCIKDFENIIVYMNSPYKEFVEAATGIVFKYAYETNPFQNKDRWSDFITCVAASTHHQNKQGGLFLHSFGVVKNIIQIYSFYENMNYLKNINSMINIDRLKALGIVHDICKIQEYEFRKAIYRRQDIIGDHRLMFLSYSEKINQEIGNLIPDDDLRRMQYSVLSHHGPWGSYHPKTLEDTILHLADMIDSKMWGCIESGNENSINFSLQGILGAMEGK